MKIKFAPRLITLSLLTAALCLPALAQDTVLTYQGQVLDNGTNFNGPGQFKFALVTSTSSSTYVTYWSNDGTSVAGSEPSAAVGVSVSKGLFTVVLGDTTLAHMTALPRSVFTTQPNLQLRIWFNDGVSGFAALSPLQNLTPAPYAVMANSAINLLGGDVSAGDVSAGSVEVAGPLYLPSIGVYPVVIYSGGSLLMDADNQHNFFTGPSAGNLTLGGSLNTGIGIDALQFDTTGTANTALGEQALQYNTGGSYNTAIGFQALVNNTNGGYNTALGALALGFNTNGNNNTAIGYGALVENRIGNDNTASGYQTLNFNTTGDYNTANGFEALYNNTNGNENVASGYRALYNNLGGSYNTAYGDSALFFNTTGNYNIANGYLALLHCTTGSGNTANGVNALLNCANGTNNTALGYSAGAALTTGNNNIDIGHPGVAGDNNTIRIGAGASSTFISGIAGVTIGSGAPVYVNSSGQLGTITSSERFKQDIHSMGAASDLLLALRPVTFRYKPELDPNGTPQFGLIAEEVSQVDPDLVVRDDKNRIYTVRYEAVNAMLLNEFLKEHRTVEAQSAEIQQLQQRLDKLEQLISQQTGGQP